MASLKLTPANAAEWNELPPARRAIDDWAPEIGTRVVHFLHPGERLTVDEVRWVPCNLATRDGYHWISASNAKRRVDSASGLFFWVAR